MKRPLCPDIARYAEILPFLKDFYQLNKDSNKNFSYRYLAKKLDWSGPYLNDIFRGRKKLSLKRALEFIDYIGLKGVKAEKFLFMFLSDTDSSFSRSSIKSNAIVARNTKKELANLSLKEFQSLGNIYAFYIITYLVINYNVWDPEDFLNRLTLNNKEVSLDSLDYTYQKLIAMGALKFEPQTGKTLILKTDGLFFDELFRHEGDKADEEVKKSELILSFEREFISNYLNFLHQPKVRDHAYFSGVIHIEPEMFDDAVDRMYSLRNYLYSLDAQTQENLGKVDNLKMMQFSLNIFSLLK